MNKDENLAKAKDFMERAEKIHKESLSTGSFSRTTKTRESIELMKNAANHFRLAKDWKSAAEAFLKAADREIANGNAACAALIYSEAATMQIKYDTTAALQSLEQKVQASCSEGKISWAAETKKQIGETYEEEKEYLLAAKSYNEAFEFYEMIDFRIHISRFNLLLKAAELKVAAEASKEHLIETIGVYENAIFKYIEAKVDPEEIYFRNLMLHLANGDVDTIIVADQKCAKMNSNLGTSQAKSSAELLIEAFKEKNFPKVITCYWQYWEVRHKKPLEAWSTAVLNRIKAQLGETTKGEAYVCENDTLIGPQC